MNTHKKHKDTYNLKVGDLFCWDRWFGDNPKERLWLAIVTKVNKKTVDLHFMGEQPVRNCELTGRTFFKDNSRKFRIDKDDLAYYISNQPRRAALVALVEELYFLGSKETL